MGRGRAGGRERSREEKEMEKKRERGETEGRREKEKREGGRKGKLKLGERRQCEDEIKQLKHNRQYVDNCNWVKGTCKIEMQFYFYV